MTSATDLNFQHLYVSLSLVSYYKLVYVLLSLTLSHTSTKHTLSHTVFVFLSKKRNCIAVVEGQNRVLPLHVELQLHHSVDHRRRRCRRNQNTEFHSSLCSKDCCKITWSKAWQRRWWTGGDVAVFALLMDVVFSSSKRKNNKWHVAW